MVDRSFAGHERSVKKAVNLSKVANLLIHELKDHLDKSQVIELLMTIHY